MQKLLQFLDIIERRMVPETGIEPVTRGFSIGPGIGSSYFNRAHYFST
jgi:hypothetical protein